MSVGVARLQVGWWAVGFPNLPKGVSNISNISPSLILPTAPVKQAGVSRNMIAERLRASKQASKQASQLTGYMYVSKPIALPMSRSWNESDLIGANYIVGASCLDCRRPLHSVGPAQRR